jgi:hypothetical protein
MRTGLLYGVDFFSARPFSLHLPHETAGAGGLAFFSDTTSKLWCGTSLASGVTTSAWLGSYFHFFPNFFNKVNFNQ